MGKSLKKNMFVIVLTILILILSSFVVKMFCNKTIVHAEASTTYDVDLPLNKTVLTERNARVTSGGYKTSCEYLTEKPAKNTGTVVYNLSIKSAINSIPANGYFNINNILININVTGVPSGNYDSLWVPLEEGSGYGLLGNLKKGGYEIGNGLGLIYKDNQVVSVIQNLFSSKGTKTISYNNCTNGSYRFELWFGTLVYGPTYRLYHQTYSFNIDNTAPTITGSIENNASTNKVFTISAADSGSGVDYLYIKKPGENFGGVANSSFTLPANSDIGWYEFYAVDKAGSKSDTYKVYYDNIVPIVEMKSGEVTIANGAFINKEFTISASDIGIGLDKLYVKSPTDTAFVAYADTYKTNTNSPNGKYECYAVDLVGNSSEKFYFYYDTVAPELKFEGLQTNDFSKTNVIAKWSVSNLSIASTDKIIVKWGFSTTSDFPNNLTVVSGERKEFTSEGNYKISIEDSAGNTTSYSFTIDKTAPTLSLSGTVDGGFTNDSVFAEWNNDVGGAGTQRSNNKDELIVKYSVNTSAIFPSSATTLYTSKTKLSSAGNYLIVITDSAGNVTQKKFTIDKTAPTLELSGVADKGFTNKNVTASWSTAVAGVTSQLSNANDSVSVSYAYSTNATFPSNANTAYSKGSLIEKEANYLFVITDRAGNITRYSFTIDKTAPTLSLSGIVKDNVSKEGVTMLWDTTVGGVGTILMNSSDLLNVRYSSAQSSYPIQATSEYRRNTLLSNEAYYYATITDKAGNSKSYNFIIDKTAPTLFVDKEFTNDTFVFSANDPRGVTIEYSFNGGTRQSVRKETIQILGEEKNFGIWEFRAVDDVGNVSSWTSVKLYKRSKFGNSDDIANGFKAAAWWQARLSAKIFPNISGTYSFASYENALNFVIAKEWQYRVETLSDNRWAYVNITNENVSQIYTNREDLDRAVLKYAKSRVSSRYSFNINGSNCPNPTDENGIVRPDALTRQNLTLPTHLSKYKELPLYFISHTYNFIAPTKGVQGNDVTSTIQFLSDGSGLSYGKIITVPYGEKIKSVLESNSAWRQGYYLVKESDKCGNTEQYLVCIDTELPTLEATAELANDKQEQIVFDDQYVSSHRDIMLYVALNLNHLRDNLDESIMVMIDGRGFDNTIFIDSDELPYLSYEKGFWGVYTITVYDRSCNALVFNVKIAGEAPSMKHTSLNNEIRCTLSVVNNDTNNAITELALYKVAYDGSYNRLLQDDDGTTINAATLSYVFRTGGKYVMRITDIYGRTVETPPIFYLKGLPVGILRGVKDGGVTNKDVTIEYAVDCNLLLYVWENSSWVLDEETLIITEKEGAKIAEISASAEHSHLFKFFLYKEDDMNLFVEYRIEIDSIAPVIDITSEQGEEINVDEVTQKNFKVTWNENGVSVYFYRAEDSLGELGKKKYVKGTIISQAGTYVFSAIDTVGNATNFNVVLDNVVDYMLEGDFSILSDNTFVSRMYLTLTVRERTNCFECTSSNGLIVANGQKLEVDGTYVFYIEDMYGNTLRLTIIIDKLPPEPIIKTVSGKSIEKNGKTNQGFIVSCDELDVTILISTSSTKFMAYDGQLIENQGVYTFRMTDRMNNSITFTVEIDQKVSFNIVGKYLETESNQFLSKGNISIKINEKYVRFEVSSNNEISIRPDEKITQEGIYHVLVEDEVGNVESIVIVIDQTPPEPIIKTVSGKNIEENMTINEGFIISSNEADIKIEYSLNNRDFLPYNGTTFDTFAIYYFRMTDIIGNSSTFTVTIDKTIDFTISGTYIIDSLGQYVSRTGIVVKVNEEYKRFEVSSNNEISIRPDEKITQEGIYHVLIEDLGSNIVEFVVVIDKTPPTPIIKTYAGEDVQLNSTINKSFIVSSTENDVQIEFSKTGVKYEIYNGTTISDEATYYFRMTDIIGNSISYKIVVDLSVHYSLKGTYKKVSDNYYATKNNIVLEISENYAAFNVVAKNGNVIELGKKITQEDIYTITIVDMVGNKVEIIIDVDYTPPTIELVGINENNCSQTEVVVNISNFATAECTILGQNIAIYEHTTFDKEGTYRISAVDDAGNEISVTFSIDKSVEVSVSQPIVDRQYITKSIGFEFGEKMSEIILAKDGEVIPYKGGNISEVGVYVLTATDLLGNQCFYKFQILNEISNRFELEVFDYAVTATLNKGAVGVIENDKIVLVKDGNYVLTFTASNGAEYELELVVDTVAPTVEIVKTKDKVVIKRPSKDSVTLKMFRNGKEVNCILGQAITTVGDYVLIVTDELGNTTKYDFSLHYINAFGIIVITLAAMLIIGLVGVAVVTRIRQKVK